MPETNVDHASLRIAFVAALEREVAPLIRGWKSRTLERVGLRLFEEAGAFLVCGGIGPEAARRATEAVIQEVQPSRIVSIGFAGALDPALKVGDIVEPGTVINTQDGARTKSGSGNHILVSYAGVAGREQKAKLRDAYGAALVDMEAAAVAQGVEARGIEFGSVKVISDDAAFAMPDMARFIGPDGRFRQSAFAMHVAIRPWLWGSTMTLARNSDRARRALCGAIADYLKRERLRTAVSR